MRKNIGIDLQALMAHILGANHALASEDRFRNHETYVHLWSTSPNTVFEDTLQIPFVRASPLLRLPQWVC